MITFKLPDWFWEFSEWVDDKIFPLPNNQRDLAKERMQYVERSAAYITKQMKSCRNIRQTVGIKNMINNMPALHGNTIQVQQWMKILHTDLHNKKTEIINNRRLWKGPKCK